MDKKKGKESKIELKDSFIDDSKMYGEEYWIPNIEITTTSPSRVPVPSKPHLGEIKMSNSQQHIAVDISYKIRDNQFWYTDCSFRNLIEDKQSIMLHIEGLGTRSFIHSEQGRDGRPTYSYKLKTESYEDRIWWEEHSDKHVRVELLSINEDFEPHPSKVSEMPVEIEILRGYEVLPDNNVRFGVRVINNNNAVITDVEVILDYPESLFSLQDSRIQKLGNIAPTIARTAKFVLKPLGCVHKEFIEATIAYRDHMNQKHIVTMKPKEIHCVCPFLRAKPITKTDFLDLSKSGHSVEIGINFQGISAPQLKSFLMQTCANRLHKVDDHSVDGGSLLNFSSESMGEKAHYLLTVLIKEQEGLTQVMLRAVSDKTHGIHGFLNEIVSELKHMVHTVASAKEIGIIKHEHVINIIDSVVQHSSFSIGDSSSPLSTNIQDSIVQHTAINTNASKRSDEEIARIARQEHEKMKELSKERSKKSLQKNDKKKLLIPILALVLLGGLWFGLSGSTGNQDILHVQEPIITDEVPTVVSPEKNTDENEDAISDILEESVDEDALVSDNDNIQENAFIVYLDNNEFEPYIATISVGDTIQWVKKDHSAQIIKSSVFQSATMREGDTFSYTFDETGTYDYQIITHPWALGGIVEVK